MDAIGKSDDAPISRKPIFTQTVDFTGDGLAVRAMVEGERLAYGHMANPAFATEGLQD